jgi:hypothetical protein
MSFQINGINYQAAKLDAKRQFHVARRLAPILSSLVAAMPKESTESEAAGFNVRMLMPIADAISQMSDEACDYVLDACLSVTQRQDGQIWAQVTASNGRIMYPDIDMSVMLQIASNVIQASLGNYFPGAAGAIAATKTS